MSITIIPATHADAARLTKLHQASFANAAWSQDQIAGSLDLPTTHTALAISDNGDAGFMMTQITQDHSEILTFCVSPTFRRQGIAARLMQDALDAVRSTGCLKLILEVAADNAPALALYHKAGFQNLGRRANYYAHTTPPVEALVLALTFRPSVP